MKHISEFDFSGHFPIHIEGELISSPDEYASFLVRKKYAYVDIVAELVVTSEEIQASMSTKSRKRGGK